MRIPLGFALAILLLAAGGWLYTLWQTAVIERRFPDAAELYAGRGWRLPRSIGRVYDASLAERELGFRCRVDFASILDALREGRALPFAHDASYVSPSAGAVTEGA